MLWSIILFLLSLWFTNRSTTHPQQDPQITPDPSDTQRLSGIEKQALLLKQDQEDYRIHIQMGNRDNGHPPVASEVSHLGWGHWYTLRDLEAATDGFAAENEIGQGGYGYGIVYLGLLDAKTQVAVKNLLNNKGQAEKEFEVEVEAIGRVRHKNLLILLGYRAEGAHRYP